jgi:hypothetical protein
MGRGSPNAGTKARPQLLRRQSVSTLAPANRWAQMRRNGTLLTRQAGKQLGLQIYAAAARPGQEPLEPSSIEGNDFERFWARAVGSAARCQSVQRDPRGHLDVIASGLLLDRAAQVGWECKVANNRQRTHAPVLCRLHPDEIGQLSDDVRPSVLGGRLLRALGKAHRTYCDERNITDSRLSFLWGQPEEGRMLLWQEPYYPDEIDLRALSWERSPKGLVARNSSGKTVFSWYPRGHQFHYHALPPADALAFDLPSHSLDDLSYAEAVVEALEV